MRNDNTTTDIKNLIFTITSIGDIETKNKVLEILEDCKYLTNVERALLDEYKTLCDEVEGIPTVGTLVARNNNYGNSIIIASDSIIDFTRIFVRNKQMIQMHTLIHEGLDNYISGKIDFDSFGGIVQSALVVGTPSKMEEEIESNLDDSFYEKLTEIAKSEGGIKLGIPCIDELYRGIMPGDLLTIAGFTGSMKTTLSANIAYNAAYKGKNVLYLSLEVSKEDLTFALLSRHSLTIPNGSVARSEIKDYAIEQKDKFLDLCKSYNELPGRIRIIDEKDITSYSATAFNEVIAKVNEELIEKTGHKADLIVLDHIQLLKFNDSKSATDNPYQLINYYTSYFREKAAREGYSVILVSQTSRQGYEYACKHNGRYLETGLAEANELERASTGIITVFATENGKNSNEITVQLLKNRFGEKMADPDQAPLIASHFMVGTGLSMEAEEVGPVFDINSASLFTDQGSSMDTFSLEDMLSGS